MGVIKAGEVQLKSQGRRSQSTSSVPTGSVLLVMDAMDRSASQ